MNRTKSPSTGASRHCTRPHGVDAAARRQRLLARHPERRAVRQAQPAGHARRQLLLVEAQVEGHQATLRCRVIAPARSGHRDRRARTPAAAGLRASRRGRHGRRAGASAWPRRGAARRSPRSSDRRPTSGRSPAAKSSYQRAGQPHCGSLQQHRVVPPGRRRAQQVPVQQDGTVGGHRRRCRGGRRRGTRPGRRPSASPRWRSIAATSPARAGWSSVVADVGEQAIEVPPRERLGAAAAGSPVGTSSGARAWTAATIRPIGRPVGLGVDEHQALPRRRRRARRRRRHRDAPAPGRAPRGGRAARPARSPPPDRPSPGRPG